MWPFIEKDVVDIWHNELQYNYGQIGLIRVEKDILGDYYGKKK